MTGANSMLSGRPMHEIESLKKEISKNSRGGQASFTTNKIVSALQI